MELDKILEVLKPKTASLGFTKDELKSVAQNIADNLSLKDDATEDETTEAITKAVDGVVPILKLSQSASQRIIQASKQKQSKTDDDDDDDKTKGGDKNKQTKKDDDDEPGWFKAYREAQEKRIADLEQNRRNDGYSKKAKERFKDIDEDFSSMALEGKTFKTDEEFETFATNLEGKWATYQQKLADRGLKTSAKPTKGGGNHKDELPEALKERIAEDSKDKSAPIMGLD